MPPGQARRGGRRERKAKRLMDDAIKPLQSGEIELHQARQAHQALEAARKKHELAQKRRAEAFAAASAAGVKHQRIADAVGVSLARVGQIIGGKR